MNNYRAHLQSLAVVAIVITLFAVVIRGLELKAVHIWAIGASVAFVAALVLALLLWLRRA